MQYYHKQYREKGCFYLTKTLYIVSKIDLILDIIGKLSKKSIGY